MQAVRTRIEPTSPDAEHVDDVVRASGSSFFWAMRLLPAERRQAMYAVYAFCRAVDDVADAILPEETKRRELDLWRQEIDALYRDRPTRPITRTLHSAVHRYGLAQRDFEAVIDGMAMDAGEPIVAPERDQLMLYCDRVAGAVGRLSVAVFGVGDARGHAVAGHLGRALQLTNILRDLDEDAAVGRLYLPRETLAAHGVPLAPVSAVLSHPDIDAVCQEVAGWADAAFAGARNAMAACDARAMRPARIMMHVYACTFERLRTRGWQPPRRAVTPSKTVKLWIALRTCLGTTK